MCAKEGSTISSEKFDLIIIGAGPAGLSAAIYAARSGLKCIVLEKGMPGGQVFTSPWINNYPGFSHIEGSKLMELMISHAKEYVEIREGSEVVGIESIDDIFRIKLPNDMLECRGIVMAMGAYHRMLDVSGEKKYSGKGVSYCATCDGFFFRGKTIIVGGGGNTAITDALYLQSIGCDVTLVHRRDQLRADNHLQNTAAEKGLKLMLNSVVEKISGDENIVTEVEIRNTKTGAVETIPIDGIFIAVGTAPNSSLPKSLGVHLDNNDFVKVGKDHRTNIPFVYAAGDLVGGILQIVAAVHGGAVAAISAFEDLTDPYFARTRSQ